MAQQPVISVRGEARTEAEPEIATLSVTVQARDRDRRTVLDRLATRNSQVLDLIKGYGEAVEKLESGAASVYPDIRYKERAERVRSYLGQASARVVIRDFTVLGELMARLADGELVTVAGPWWSLRPDSPVYRQARIAAARDATRRAGEYAEAFGGELGGLIEAADTGLLTGQAQQGVAFRANLAGGAARASAAEPAEMDFEPVKQTVTAQVDARFGMLLPLRTAGSPAHDTGRKQRPAGVSLSRDSGESHHGPVRENCAFYSEREVATPGSTRSERRGP